MKQFKKYSIVLLLALSFFCYTPKLKIPNLPKVPNITNSVSLPKLNIDLSNLNFKF